MSNDDEDGSGDTPPPPPLPNAGMAAAAMANGGGGGDLECSIYQNYSASEVFVQGLAGVVNQQARDQGHLVHSFIF